MMEFGSDFNYIDNFHQPSINNLIWGNMVGNGRQAIHKILQIHEIETLWLPSYFCYDIIPYLENKVNVKYYKSNPKANTIDISDYTFTHKEAILLVDYFGFNTQYQLPQSAENAIVIEDKSHNVYSHNVNRHTNYIVGSLRKSLPIPDGGFLKKTHTQTQTQLSLNINEIHKKNSFLKLEAMLLKSLYLKAITKDQNLKGIFRKKYIQSEDAINDIKVSKISDFSSIYLKYFDFNNWFNQRRENLLFLINTLKNISNFQIVNSLFKNIEDHIGLILEFQNSNDRDLYRQKMIENNIYPAVLWNIPSFNKHLTSDFHKKTLMLHCDARYSIDEIKQLANTIIKINNDRNNKHR